MRIAGYCRLSVEDEDALNESSSIANQKRLIKKYISSDKELRGYEYCEFCDDGYSGTTMERPEMKKLLEQIKNNEINIVIVKDISRFSRDYIDFGTYIEQIFPLMGIRFISVSDRYDSSRQGLCPTDIIFKSLIADFYCKEISEKVRDSLKLKRDKGLYATGAVPFGYKKAGDDRNMIVPDCEAADVVRHIFKLAQQGFNLIKISSRLDEEGIRTPYEFKRMREEHEMRWHPATVRNILINENYIGNMVYEKTRKDDLEYGRRTTVAMSEWKRIIRHHEPLIDRTLFAQIQKKYNKNYKEQ